MMRRAAMPRGATTTLNPSSATSGRIPAALASISRSSSIGQDLRGVASSGSNATPSASASART